MPVPVPLGSAGTARTGVCFRSCTARRHRVSADFLEGNKDCFGEMCVCVRGGGVGGWGNAGVLISRVQYKYLFGPKNRRLLAVILVSDVFYA